MQQRRGVSRKSIRPLARSVRAKSGGMRPLARTRARIEGIWLLAMSMPVSRVEVRPLAKDCCLDAVLSHDGFRMETLGLQRTRKTGFTDVMLMDMSILGVVALWSGMVSILNSEVA